MGNYSKIILVCMAFGCFTGLKAQDNFSVIKVNGNIVIESSGSALDIGTVFAQDENLLFKISTSRAAVINPDKGRYVLTMDNKDDFATGKTVFLPSAGKISTRGGPILNIRDLGSHFTGNYVIFNRNRIKLNPIFRMNDSCFFFIRYNLHGEDINKKLFYHNDTLIIDKKELLSVDGKQIPNPDISEMKLMHLVIGENYLTEPVCTFTPVFPDQDKLKAEVEVILEALKDKTYDEKLNEVEAHILDFYGKTERQSLEYWLRENFNLLR